MKASMVAAAEKQKGKRSFSQSVNVEKQRLAAKVTALLERMAGKKKGHEEAYTKQQAACSQLEETEAHRLRAHVALCQGSWGNQPSAAHRFVCMVSWASPRCQRNARWGNSFVAWEACCYDDQGRVYQKAAPCRCTLSHLGSACRVGD